MVELPKLKVGLFWVVPNIPPCCCDVVVVLLFKPANRPVPPWFVLVFKLSKMPILCDWKALPGLLGQRHYNRKARSCEEFGD